MKLYQNKDWLYEQYHIKGLSQRKIGKLRGVSRRPIGYWIKKFKIEKLIKQYQNKNWLEEQYIIKKRSVDNITKEFKIPRTNIYKGLKKFEIPIRSCYEAALNRSNHCLIFSEAQDWIDGELLGDGNVFPYKNSSARFQHSSKFEEYINYISSTLDSFGIKQSGKIYHRQFSKGYIIAGRPILKDIDAYCYGSRYYPELMSIRRRWYPNGKKIVPKDIELTPLTCRQWYIGDGSLVHQKRGKNPYIQLSTCGFSIFDVELLIQKLNKLGFKSTRQPSWNKIYISTKSTKDFLDYIGQCPVNCYQYKWSC